MSNVIIDKSKIDILANAISDKSGVPVTMTLDEMVEAVDGIEANPAPTLQAKTYTVDSAGTETIMADSGYDGLSEVDVTVPEAFPYIGHESEFYTQSNARRWRIRGKATVDAADECPPGYYDEGTYYGSYSVYKAVASGTTVTPTESAQTIGGTNYMMEGAVTVNAIPSNYVGSGITQRSSSDLTASGATVTVPSGYYSSNASKAVASGTEGTPTATKGSVSNHSISVTPSVTNTAGYITGGTKTGTAVTVSASELVSGTYTVDSSGTKDVTNYASASVPSGTAGTPSASKGAVSNHSVSVTPSVTNTTGWITGSTKTGTAVTVTASELASGNKAITQNGTGIDVVGYSTVSVNVAGAEYTRTVIAPQQTVSPSSAMQQMTLTSSGLIEDAKSYIVTIDNVEWLTTCETLWSANYCIGDVRYFLEASPSSTIYPFGVICEGGIIYACFATTGSHTIKIERLDFVTGGTTLTTKNITANGTYNASSDSADGYSSVTVNVSGGGGASNFVTGTFTTGATTNTTGTFTIPYTGTGYPIMLVVVIEGGMYNSSSGGNTTWYNSTQRYAVGEFVITKARTTSAPTYETSGGDNYGVVLSIYKNSTSSATTYGRALSTTANSYSSSDATSSNILTVRFKGNGKTVSYYIGYYTSSNSYAYGLMANTTYRYWAVYSS